MSPLQRDGMSNYLVLPLIAGVSGITYLIRGADIRIGAGRVVPRELGRSLALLLVIAAAIDLATVLGFQSIVFASLIALVAAIVIGLAAAE